jgi:hypothetical protein
MSVISSRKRTKNIEAVLKEIQDKKEHEEQKLQHNRNRKDYIAIGALITAIEASTISICIPGGAGNGYDEYVNVINANALLEALRDITEV